MKRFLLLLLPALLHFSALQAQDSFSLRGRLVDPAAEGLPYANVAVLQAADSALISGAVSDMDGAFQLKLNKAGEYLLRITAIGFRDLYTQTFSLKTGSPQKDFGTLKLEEDVKRLDEVTVEALRPTIINEPDKTVVSVEGTALAAGSTAYDVLAKSPGVWVDQDGNIQLNGKAGVRVMIDGRPTYLSARELQSMLEGMSAENIKSIELITKPSARYEAEGSSGIININLKKNTHQGMNGSLYSGYSYNGLHNFSTGGNLNLKKEKWNSYISLDIARRARQRRGKFERLFNAPEGKTYFDQDAREDVIRKTPSLRLGTDYDLNEQHSIGGMLNLMYHESSHDFLTDTYFSASGQDQLFIDANNRTDNTLTNAAANLHYLNKLDTLGSTLSADLDYVRLSESGDARFENYYDSLTSGSEDYSEILTTYNPTYYDIYSAKLDFVRAFGEGKKLEAGAKFSHVVSDNDLQFFINEGDIRQPDPRRSNHFVYTEQIYAGYASYSTPLGKKFSLQAGLRAEQTVAEGESLTLDQKTPRNYLDLFPSLFLQQKVSENYQINYSYGRRIERPQYGLLNPFIFYLDPYTWAQGNPYLRPQYTHAIGINQTFKQMYSLNLEYALIKDFIAEVPEQNLEDKTTVFNRANVDDGLNLSATLVVPIKVIDKWDISNNAVVAYQEYNSLVNNIPVKNDQVFFYAQSTHNILLPASIRLELSADYQGPLVWGLYRMKARWGMDAGLKKSFMDDKLDLSLNFSDIFRTRRVIGGANYNGNINQFNQYFSFQSAGIMLRYNFSKGEKFESRQRKTNLEELNRTGG